MTKSFFSCTIIRMDNVIPLILLTAGISIFLNTLLRRVNIEAIIGYIFTGAIVAYISGIEGYHNPSLELVSELGIAFLMFTIGLEMSIEKLKSIKKEVFVYGGAQMIFTSLVFYFITRYIFGVDIASSLIISLGLSLSSTAIVLKLLNESKTLHKTYGKNALGVLLFQDIAVIPILFMIPIMANAEGLASDVLIIMLRNTFLIISGFFLCGKYLALPFFDFIANAKSDEIFIAAVLFVVIGAAQLTHQFGFSYSLGAFMAGIIIARTHYKHQIEADLIPFRDIFLGVFFIAVGMQLNLNFIPDNILHILLILVAVIFIKAAIIFIIMKMGYRRQTSLKTAVILAQVGEFSFVVFELAKINNLFIDEVLSQTITVSIIFSMILTPFVFKHLHPISSLFTPDEDDDEAELLKDIDLNDHTIVCGYGALGQRVTKNLKHLGIPYIVIERDNALVTFGRNQDDNIILGNSAKKSILEKVNLNEAKAIIVAIPHKEKMIRIVGAIRTVAPNVKIIAKAHSLYQKDFLETMGNVAIIDEIHETADSVINLLSE